MRIGHGFDVHAFGGEGPIIIGGVRIPYEKGLLAHSDGDVALHALTDALLGAAALGISASCSRIPIRHLKVPTAASVTRSLASYSGEGLYAGQRRCHYHRSGTEDVAAHTTNARVYCRRSRLPYG